MRFKPFKDLTFEEQMKEATFNILKSLLITLAFITMMILFLWITQPREAFACSRDIQKLTPELRTLYYKFENKAKKQNIDFIVICTERTQHEQDKLYAKGRTKPGKKVTWRRTSKHTGGLAFDVAVKKNGNISWEPRDYYVLGEIAQELGLTWGGNWTVGDYGHFEINDNKNTRRYEEQPKYQKKTLKYEPTHVKKYANWEQK